MDVQQDIYWLKTIKSYQLMKLVLFLNVQLRMKAMKDKFLLVVVAVILFVQLLNNASMKICNVMGIMTVLIIQMKIAQVELCLYFYILRIR